MAGSWQYEINGKTFGPVSFDGLVEKAKTGELNPGHHVTSGETGETFNAGKVSGLFAQSEIVLVGTTEKWFCWIGSKEYGPVSTIQLENWIKEKRVSPDDFIRPGHLKEWFFAGLYKDLFEEAGITGAADALIRQLHPELFGKKKELGLDKNSPKDEYDRDAENSHLPEPVHTAVMEKPEVVQKAPKRKVDNHKSLSEILMIVPRFIMDLWVAVIDKLAKIFPQTKTAWTILLGSISAILVVLFVLLPPLFEPHFENEECHEILDTIFAEMLKMRTDGATPAEWTEFSKRESLRLKVIVNDMENTAGVRDPYRQYLLFAGRDNLLEILKDPKNPSAKHEEEYRKLLGHAKNKIEWGTRAQRRSR